MQYEENKETIKETFNVSFKENEIIPEKKQEKENWSLPLFPQF